MTSVKKIFEKMDTNFGNARKRNNEGKIAKS